VGFVSRDPRDRPGRAVGAVGRARQVAAHGLVVPAVRIVEGDGELRAVRLVEGDVRVLVLRDGARSSGPERPRAPDVLGAREDRMRTGGWVRIRDLRPVEPDCLVAVDDRCGRDHPFRRVAVLEVGVAGSARELVEAPCRIRAVVAGVTAVSVDVLWPGVLAILWIVVRPRAVVLRPALDLTWVPWVDGHANELERIVVAVDVRGRRRHPRKHSPTVRQARGAEKAALVRVAP